MGQNNAAQRADLTLEQLAELLRGKLGDENLRPGGLGTALIKDGEPIGRTNGVIAFASGAPGAGGIVTIEHKLGRIPGYCRVLQVIPPAGASPSPGVLCGPVGYEKWSETTLRVDLIVVAGSLDGCIVVLEIGGERVG